jgi:hypothetical protein
MHRKDNSDMTLSAEELKQAWVAGEDVKCCDSEKIFFPLYSILGLLMLLMHLAAHSGRLDLYAIPIVCLIRGAISGLRYRKLDRGYLANLRLLEAFYERDPSLFEYVDRHPILRKTEEQKRPLLWRFDRLLSGERQRSR